MARSPQDGHSLEPVLRESEAELTRLLHEACDAEERGVANGSSAEIRRLEDALLAAAVAAKQTIRLREQVAKDHEVESVVEREGDDRAGRSAAADRAEVHDDTATGTVREFTDRSGHAWRAWPVTPGATRTGRTRNFLGEFQLGWVCFEGLDDSARRRLAGHPERWSELTDDELDALLQRAQTARERPPASPPLRSARQD